MDKKNRRRIVQQVMMGDSVHYLMRDTFATDLAAGSVNGTSATPGPGTRSVTDTTPGALITGGRYSSRVFVDYGNPCIAWVSTSRVKGRMLVGKVFPARY